MHPAPQATHPEPFLVCQVKRFQANDRGKTTKISMFVGFPASIDLSSYLHRDADKELRKNATFELYGVVSHSGSLNSGHYVAYARDPSVRKPSQAQLIAYRLLPERDSFINAESFVLASGAPGRMEVLQ